MFRYVLGAVIVILIIIVFYKMTQKMRDKVEASNVIKMSLNRDRQSKAKNKKTCSFCRKKATRLSFYAAEQDGVVGVCDLCRPIAERRALLRL